MVKIIHSADMHLDAPMISAKRHKSELIRDFKRLIELTNSKEADLLLISGDLFDTPFPEEKCVSDVIDILSSCRCEVFISPGNHDPYTESSVYYKTIFPDNVHIFTSPQIKRVRASCGADVYGCAFTSSAKKRISLGEAEDPDAISIYSIHADLGANDSTYAPISASEIEMTNADYVALGHIHKRSSVQKAGKTAYAYSGCLSAKDFGECGEKGVIFGIFDNSDGICQSHFEFLPLHNHRYEIVNVSLTDFSHINELKSHILEIITREGFDAQTSLRVVFKGEKADGVSLSPTAFDDISNRLFEFEYEDRSRPAISKKDLENDPTLRGEIYRVLKDQLEGGDKREAEVARLALRLALSAIDNEDILEITKTEEIDT